MFRRCRTLANSVANTNSIENNSLVRNRVLGFWLHHGASSDDDMPSQPMHETTMSEAKLRLIRCNYKFRKLCSKHYMSLERQVLNTAGQMCYDIVFCVIRKRNAKSNAFPDSGNPRISHGRGVESARLCPPLALPNQLTEDYPVPACSCCQMAKIQAQFGLDFVFQGWLDGWYCEAPESACAW